MNTYKVTYFTGKSRRIIAPNYDEAVILAHRARHGTSVADIEPVQPNRAAVRFVLDGSCLGTVCITTPQAATAKARALNAKERARATARNEEPRGEYVVHTVQTA